jgi:hypothetical protein
MFARAVDHGRKDLEMKGMTLRHVNSLAPRMQAHLLRLHMNVVLLGDVNLFVDFEAILT